MINANIQKRIVERPDQSFLVSWLGCTELGLNEVAVWRHAGEDGWVVDVETTRRFSLSDQEALSGEFQPWYFDEVLDSYCGDGYYSEEPQPEVELSLAEQYAERTFYDREFDRLTGNSDIFVPAPNSWGWPFPDPLGQFIRSQS